MPLELYLQPNENDKISSNTHLNPFVATIDGLSGGLICKKIYLRNDSVNRWYSDISVRPVGRDGTPNMVNGTLGYTWKLIWADNLPPREVWDRTAPGNTIYFTDVEIGSSSESNIKTYLSFWVQVGIVAGRDISNLTNVILKIRATENLIDD